MSTPQLAELRKQVHKATLQINLMRQALHRADTDFEETGTVTCETMEFIRSVKELLS
ncbi:hypothetical protein [Undibacterium curvum]|uniref:Rop family plasmid primer RNA-binding protein n=1 Tax=Undibacterium curvum TaxID=2762294 RepID=A0ABR7A579_9BURK|nr:hypothetical protein [Undibacterium curvum]MBC3932002.1 hypothetical protein [Undibacterium curvum]